LSSFVLLVLLVLRTCRTLSAKAPVIIPATHHDPGAHNKAYNPRIVIPASSLSENTPVMLAKAGIQPIFLDSRLRGNDVPGPFRYVGTQYHMDNP
jgi:hypothetical protein